MKIIIAALFFLLQINAAFSQSINSLQSEFEKINEDSHSYFYCYDSGGYIDLQEVRVIWNSEDTSKFRIVEKVSPERSDGYFMDISNFRNSVQVLKKECNAGFHWVVAIGCAQPCKCKYDASSIGNSFAGAALCGGFGMDRGQFHFSTANQPSAERMATILRLLISKL